MRSSPTSLRDRAAVLLAIAFAAVAFAGCGDKHAFTTEAETEGVYLDVGDLVYQVQLSRFLNPSDVEDKQYLTGLPPGTVPPGGDEIWFGVWMRVKNYSGAAQRPTAEFKITDTESNEYRPVPQNRAVNPFIFVAQPLPPAGVLPAPDSAAASGPIQGSLILFRLKTPSLQDRPLVLHIEGTGQEATVDLDL